MDTWKRASMGSGSRITQSTTKKHKNNDSQKQTILRKTKIMTQKNDKYWLSKPKKYYVKQKIIVINNRKKKSQKKEKGKSPIHNDWLEEVSSVCRVNVSIPPSLDYGACWYVCFPPVDSQPVRLSVRLSRCRRSFYRQSLLPAADHRSVHHPSGTPGSLLWFLGAAGSWGTSTPSFVSVSASGPTFEPGGRTRGSETTLFVCLFLLRLHKAILGAAGGTFRDCPCCAGPRSFL